MAKYAFTDSFMVILSNQQGLSLEPVIGINKDVSGTRLLPMTVSTYLVD